MPRRSVRLTSAMALVALEDGRPDLSLPLGLLTLGHSRRCDLVLRGEGVRLRHATLHVESTAATIERSEPAAELRVNEVPVQRAAVTPGDVLSVGSVRLRLESRRPPPLPEAKRPDPRPDLAERRGDWVDLLEQLFVWSRERPLERRGTMLGLLVERLGARGAALVISGPAPRVSVVTSWGEVLGVLRETWLLELLERSARGEDAAVEAREGWDLARLRLPAGRAIGLVVHGRAEGWDPQLLRLCLRFLAHEYLRADLTEGRPAATPLPLAFLPGAVVGHAPSVRALYAEVGALLHHDAPVLIRGETGTGKEAIARLIHDSSGRRALPFVVLDGSCGEDAFAASLARHLLGSPPPRRGERPAGTLLIDELGRLGPAQQSHLISALDRLQRARAGTGSAGAARLLVSTNLELDGALARGDLRPDLYFRIAAFVLTVPPLRERCEDIPLLFEHYLLAEVGAKRPALAPEALAALMRYRWPGNLRELRQEATRAASRTRDVVTLSSLSTAVVGEAPAAATTPGAPSLDLHQEIERLERALVPVALAQTGGNLSAAARLLGVSRPWLRRRLRAAVAPPTAPSSR